MSKDYLLIGPSKKKFRRWAKLFYFNEFSQNFFYDKKKNGTCGVNNLLESRKVSSIFSKDLNFIKKKVSYYLSELTIKLNNIHNLQFNKKYWGLILENYLFLLVSDIYLNKKIIEKHKKKIKSFKLINEKIYLKKSSSINFFLEKIINDQNFSKFVKSKILISYLGKSKKKFKYFISNDKSDNKENILLIILKKIILFYIKLVKPVIILNPYFGKKNSLILCIKSFGRILVIHRNFLFPIFQNDFNRNISVRKKISVREHDIFDQVFNEINKEFFPASFLENFKRYNYSIINLKDFIKILGSSTLIYSDDYYKALAAQIKSINGKIINFQHGGCYEKFKFDIQNEFEKKYCDKRYFWHQINPIGNTFLPKLEQFKKKDFEGKKILILPTEKKLHDNINAVINRTYNNKFNPIHKLNFQLFNNLKKDLKDQTIVKLFPDKNSAVIKKIWQLNTTKNIKIFSDGPYYKYKWFKETRIVIMDDISTPLYETLYLNVPTVIICNELDEFNQKFKTYITKLKKLNIYFENAIKASNFINKNYEKIDIWWNNVLKSPDFIKFKNQLFVDKSFNPNNSLTKDILRLRS